MRFAKNTGSMLFTLAEDLIGSDGRVIHRAGEKITMAVTPSDVRTVEELDTYLGGYSSNEFCMDLVSKPVLVDKSEGITRDLSKENVYEVVDDAIGPLGHINEVDIASSTGSYKTQDRGLATFVRWDTENEATFAIRAVAAKMLLEKVMLGREVRGWAKLTTLANWAVTNRTSLGAATYWDTGASKNPLQNLRTRINASLAKVTDIYFNPEVAGYFLSDTEVRAYMKQMLGDGAPNPAVAAAAAASQQRMSFVIPGYPTFTIVPGRRTNATTGVVEYILADDVVLACVPPGVPRDGSQMATSYSFRQKGSSGTGIITNEYIPMDKGLNKGVMLETGFSEDLKMMTTTAGGLIKDVLS